MRYSLKTDWLFYLFLVSYAYLILTMTIRLWFGGGIQTSTKGCLTSNCAKGAATA